MKETHKRDLHTLLNQSPKCPDLRCLLSNKQKRPIKITKAHERDPQKRPTHHIELIPEVPWLPLLTNQRTKIP